MHSIIYFSSMPFDFLFQRPQEISVQLANKGFKCGYIYKYPLHKHKSDSSSLKRIPENIDLNPVMLLPRRLSTLIDKIKPVKMAEQIIVKRQIAKYLKNYQRPRIAFVSEWGWAPYINRNDFDLLIYDYIDDLDVFRFPNARSRDIAMHYHQWLVKESDCVSVTANQKLQTEVETSGAKKVIVVGNGVSNQFFKQQLARVDGKKRVKQLKKEIGRPMVGYVGAIWDWFDLEMVLQTAQMCKEVCFMLVGPVSPSLSKIAAERATDNVIFFGQVNKEEVPTMISAFDIAIIPFYQGTISDGTDPIKLYEYFVEGKPVISTPMLALRPYEEQGLIKFVTNAAEFSQAIKAYLQTEPAPSLVNQRKTIALNNDWSNKVEILADYIKNNLPR